MVSAVNKKIYEEARRNGADLTAGNGTWAGVVDKNGQAGQLLIAKKKDGSFIAVDNAGHVQALEGATTKEAAAAQAKQAYASGSSRLSELAGFSKELQGKLNTASGNDGGSVAPQSGGTAETGQAVNPADTTSETPQPRTNDSKVTQKPALATPNSAAPVNATNKFQKINFNNQIGKYIVGRQSVDGNKTIALVVKDPTAPNTYYAVGDNQVIEFKSQSDEAANTQVNDYLKNNQLKSKTVGINSSKNTSGGNSQGSDTESSQQVLDAANAKGQTVIDNAITGS